MWDQSIIESLLKQGGYSKLDLNHKRFMVRGVSGCSGFCPLDLYANGEREREREGGKMSCIVVIVVVVVINTSVSVGALNFLIHA